MNGNTLPYLKTARRALKALHEKLDHVIHTSPLLPCSNEEAYMDSLLDGTTFPVQGAEEHENDPLVYLIKDDMAMQIKFWKGDAIDVMVRAQNGRHQLSCPPACCVCCSDRARSPFSRIGCAGASAG